MLALPFQNESGPLLSQMLRNCQALLLSAGQRLLSLCNTERQSVKDVSESQRAGKCSALRGAALSLGFVLMNDARNVTLSAALFVLLCFFLPWLQVSCAGLKDSASGLDLAREASPSLWIIPFLMLAVIGVGLTRSVWERLPAVFAITSIVGAGLSAYLMYRERLRRGEASGLITAFWTAWFWLGLVASVLLSAVALSSYSDRNKE